MAERAESDGSREIFRHAQDMLSSLNLRRRHLLGYQLGGSLA